MSAQPIVNAKVQHWDDYYTAPGLEVPCPQDPSSFAEACLPSVKALQADIGAGAMLEFGCGNGRDALFFAAHGLDVLAGDISSGSIQRLRKEHHCGGSENNNTNPLAGKPWFFCRDFTRLNDDSSSSQDLGFLQSKRITAVYSRFTLHSISRKGATSLLQWATANVVCGGLFAIEARSVLDPLYGVGQPVAGEADAFLGGTTHANPHYRRFIRKADLVQELESLGWTIVSCEESDNLSKHKDDNPVLLRVIARRSNV